MKLLTKIINECRLAATLFENELLYHVWFSPRNLNSFPRINFTLAKVNSSAFNGPPLFNFTKLKEMAQIP